MMKAGFIFSGWLFITLPVFSQTGSPPDSSLQSKLRSSVIWNLPAGDSVLIFESRIIYHTLPIVQIPSHKTPGRKSKITYSQTSKYVIRKNDGGYHLSLYVSDRNRSPNYRFDRVMKKQKYWRFKKFAEMDLSADEVEKFCLFERVCAINALSKYDEGDISRSMTVIRQGGKEVCSSYRDASVLDEIVHKKQ